MIITPIQLRWSDFDILRHVYNGNYQQFFDVGKSEYLEKVMNFRYDWTASEEGLVTASIFINYHIPIELNDKVEVRTCVEKIGHKSVTFYQEIRDCDSGELKTDCRTVLVGYNPINKTTFEIPDKWRKAIEEEESSK